MSEELYNSNDYCSLAEENEELKKENAELLADKLYLIGAAMDGGDKYHYAAHDIGYRDMERKVKALEADYVISNRELLILQQRIAELESVHRWIPVSERLPEFGAPILFYDSISERINKGTCTAWNADNTNLHWFTDDDLFYFGDRSEYITHWMPIPQPPEVQE